jgi:hypothetical protein
MSNILTNAPIWVFLICVSGAIITWYAADQFRDQLLGDTHRVVRMIALRYLQVMIGLFTVFAIGALFAAGSFTQQGITSVLGTPLPTATSTPAPTSTPDPFAPTPNPNLLPTAVPTELSAVGDDTLSTEPSATPTDLADDPDLQVRTAVVTGTNEIGVNVRNEPNITTSIVLVVVSDGSRVTLVDETAAADGFEWQKIIAPDGQEGWVVTIFLDETQ